MSELPGVQITLTPDELKILIREAVSEALHELLDDDYSSQPQFAPEIAERLRRYRHERPKTVSVEAVEKALGLTP